MRLTTLRALSLMASWGIFLQILYSNPSEATMQDKICDNSVLFSEKDIMQFIFENYSKDARPRKNASESVQITLSFRIRAIHDLVEKDNTLILDAYIYADWVDDYLAWNFKYPYSCFPQLVLPPGTTWLPDISLINAPNGIYSLMLAPGFSIYLSNDGSVEFAPGGQIMTTCEVDVTYFPFDQQICQINFEAWNYDVAEQSFKLDEKHAFVKVDSSWTENRQWAIEANYSDVRLVTYLGGDYYSHASFTLVLRRKSLYYWVNVIVPSLIISVVEMATFALPISEVVKVHISFTCLLAYSVFQGMVIADLPRSGDTVPLLSLYIDLQMAYIGIIALMGEAAVFTVIQKGRKDKKFPPAKLVSVFRVIARVIFVRDSSRRSATAMRRQEKEEEQEQDFFEAYYYSLFHQTTNFIHKYGIETEQPSESKQDNSNNKGKNDKLLEQRERSSPNDDKLPQAMFIAEVIARINFLLYSTAITVTPLIMFTLLPTWDEIDRSKLGFS